MSPRARFSALGGVASLSFLQLGFELLFIKLSHYEFGVLSLGVIGLAMLGVSFGGLLTRALGGPGRATERALLMLPVSVVLTGVLLFSLRHRLTDDGSTAARLLVTGAACLTTLALTTVPIYGEMVRSEAQVHALYGSSLLGAALGVPCVMGALQLLGDLRAYVALTGSIAGAIVLLVGPGRPRYLGLALTVFATALAAGALPAVERRAHPASIFRETNAISRIDVERTRQGALEVRTAGVNAGTTTATPGGKQRPALLATLSALPFKIHATRALILGTGAGKNIVQALDLGVEQVVAVEINAMIPRYMSRALPVAEDPYRDSRVTLIVGEGREVAARFALEKKHGATGFDLVYVPVATLFGSSGQTFTETYLMTREAFESYTDALGPDGVFATFFINLVRPKILNAMALALANRGVLDPSAHIAAFAANDAFFVALARPQRPFSAAERESLRGLGQDVRSLDVEQEVRQGQERISLEDDNPFLYNDILELEGKRKLWGYTAPFLKWLLLASSAVLALSAGLAFAATGRSGQTRAIGFLSAFAAMGAAYSMVQTGLIQRLTFLVGHPAAGAAIVLPSTLAATGFGSWASQRWLKDRFAVRRGGSATLLVLWIVGIAMIAPSSLMRPTWPWAGRALFAALSGAVPFVVMGSFFPIVFERVEREQAQTLSYCWFVNGVAAVLGSVLVIYGAQRLGFQSTLLISALLYAMLAGWDVLSRRNTRLRTGVDVSFAATLVMVLAVTAYFIARSR